MSLSMSFVTGFHHSQRFENEEGQDCVSSNITPFEAVKASEATGHFSSACDEMKVKLVLLTRAPGREGLF